ncbi:MAG: PAS domain-containing sensor histidine kinase [Candidatus Omnitrophica bacterium]|nr:PAS domain-containing sensor histidine kinase [Candidatus Omnitrophota bacterium]
MGFDNSFTLRDSNKHRNASGKRFHLYYETRLLLLALGAGFTGSVISLFLIWGGDYSLKVELTVTLFIALGWIGFAFAVRERVVTTMRTISNLLAAYHEGDYSLRAVSGKRDDILHEVSAEINLLGDTLRAQRISAIEAAALLQKVMDEIDVAVLAFDESAKLRLINQRARQLLDKPEQALLGRMAGELGLPGVLEGDAPRIMELTTPGGGGRWELRRGEFRLNGVPHYLIVLSNLTSALREEERQAWKRLVQVLRHEINNSLAPIHSLAQSLQNLLDRNPRPHDWELDLKQGLTVISERSKNLNRFMASYSRLTKLPKPQRAPLSVREWIHRVANLEPDNSITIEPGPDVIIQADGGQLDQALINLMKNAVEAVQETGGGVRVRWEVINKPVRILEVVVEDGGVGISNPENIFVPFFTTKSQGSGLGLMIGRQIAEAHNGSLTLENRADGPGCTARLRLPI